MNRFLLSVVCALVCVSIQAPVLADSGSSALTAIAEGDHRQETSVRNQYRHPVETLMFFGIRPDMTVVEISPGGGGWYTEILAPFLKGKGTLYAGSYDPNSDSDYFRKNSKRYSDKLAANPELYDEVIVTVFDPPALLDAAPEGSADLVLTFRNFHNWMEDGDGAEAMQAMYRYLKPGGVLGVVQHRQAPGKKSDPEGGYILEEDIIALARDAGLELAARSEINANPKDTKDHPEGVWTLPPALRREEVDRDKYLAIGESDRMTLKFIKPE